MAFCQKCGTEIGEDTKFCPSCGNPVGQADSQPTAENTQQQNVKNDYTSSFSKLFNTTDTTSEYDPADIQQNKAMGILSYIGILVLVPLFGCKQSKFAQFHAKQGFNVMLLGLAVGFINIWLNLIKFTKTVHTIWGYTQEIKYTPIGVTIISVLLWLGATAFSVIGIINAATGKQKTLPLIGKIKILK